MLPPGSVCGTPSIRRGLVEPAARPASAPAPCAPLLNVTSARRSFRSSNHSMNERAASRTAGHLGADRARHVEHERQVHQAARRLGLAADGDDVDVRQPHERRRQHDRRFHVDDLLAGRIDGRAEEVAGGRGIGTRPACRGCRAGSWPGTPVPLRSWSRRCWSRAPRRAPRRRPPCSTAALTT